MYSVNNKTHFPQKEKNFTICSSVVPVAIFVTTIDAILMVKLERSGW